MKKEVWDIIVYKERTFKHIPLTPENAKYFEIVKREVLVFQIDGYPNDKFGIYKCPIDAIMSVSHECGGLVYSLPIRIKQTVQDCLFNFPAAFQRKILQLPEGVSWKGLKGRCLELYFKIENG